ncbi:unnamed protein product [Cochlearia groenlandica]
MDSSFHYSIDLNKDHQNHHEQPFFYALGSSSSHLLLHHHHQQQQVPSTSPSSSTSISSLSSYLPFLINSQEDQQFAFNNTYDHLHLSEPLKGKMFMTNDGSSSSYDHMVPKKEIRLKLTIRKRDHHEDRTNQNPTKLNNQDSDKWIMSPKMRLIKKTITSNNKQPFDHTNDKANFDQEHHEEDLKNSYGNYNNNGFIRVCSDCNTTKTPLWRSGPQGPKSLCNACGIRQRKARRAAMVAAAAAAGDHEMAAAARLQPLPLQKKLQNKKKRSNGGEKLTAEAKKFRIKEVPSIARDSEIISTGSDSSILSNKFFLNDLTIKLSKSSAYNQQVFPQDEKEAAILLMALSYGMVQG